MSFYFGTIDGERLRIDGHALDRDGAKFGLSPEETQRHRSLMWEIYTYDSWMVRYSLGNRHIGLLKLRQSLTFGRPSSFPLSSIDCEMAYETTHNEAGELEMSCKSGSHCHQVWMLNDHQSRHGNTGSHLNV